MSVGWPELLAALEEQNRRLAASLASDAAAAGDEPVSVPLVAAGPVPAELVGRTQALLARTEELERLVVTQRARTEAALAYGGHPQE